MKLLGEDKNHNSDTFNLEETLCLFKKKIDELVAAYSSTQTTYQVLEHKYKELRETIDYLLSVGLVKEVKKQLDKLLTNEDFKEVIKQIIEELGISGGGGDVEEIINSRIAYFDNKTYNTLSERLDADYKNIYSQMVNGSYEFYKGVLDISKQDTVNGQGSINKIIGNYNEDLVNRTLEFVGDSTNNVVTVKTNHYKYLHTNAEIVKFYNEVNSQNKVTLRPNGKIFFDKLNATNGPSALFKGKKNTYYTIATGLALNGGHSTNLTFKHHNSDKSALFYTTEDDWFLAIDYTRYTGQEIDFCIAEGNFTGLPSEFTHQTDTVYINVGQPLRRISDTVYDELNGEDLTIRVGRHRVTAEDVASVVDGIAVNLSWKTPDTTNRYSNVMANGYRYIQSASLDDTDCISCSYGQISIKDKRFTSLDATRQFFRDNEIYIYYELAENITSKIKSYKNTFTAYSEFTQIYTDDAVKPIVHLSIPIHQGLVQARLVDKIESMTEQTKLLEAQIQENKELMIKMLAAYALGSRL